MAYLDLFDWAARWEGTHLGCNRTVSLSRLAALPLLELEALVRNRAALSAEHRGGAWARDGSNAWTATAPPVSKEVRVGAEPGVCCLLNRRVAGLELHKTAR